MAAASTAGHTESQGVTKTKNIRISTGMMYAAVTEGDRRPSQADTIGANERIVTSAIPVTAHPFPSRTTKYDSSQQ